MEAGSTGKSQNKDFLCFIQNKLGRFSRFAGWYPPTMIWLIIIIIIHYYFHCSHKKINYFTILLKWLRMLVNWRCISESQVTPLKSFRVTHSHMQEFHMNYQCQLKTLILLAPFHCSPPGDYCPYISASRQELLFLIHFWQSWWYELEWPLAAGFTRKGMMINTVLSVSTVSGSLNSYRRVVLLSAMSMIFWGINFYQCTENTVE